MKNKMKTRLDSREWSQIDEENAGYYFQELGFRSVGEILGLRMFDLMNMDRIDNIRAWEMVRCLYIFLNKNEEADQAMEKFCCAFSIEQDLGTFRFALRCEKTDDLLILK